MSDQENSAPATSAPTVVTIVDRPPAPSAEELDSIFANDAATDVEVEDAEADAGGEVDLSDIVAKVAGKPAKDALAEFEAAKAKQEKEDEEDDATEKSEAPVPAAAAAAPEPVAPEPAKPSAVEQARERNRQRLLDAAAKEKAKQAARAAQQAPAVAETTPAPAPAATVSLEEFKAMAKRDPMAAMRLIGEDPEEFVGRAAAQSIGIEIEVPPEQSAAPVSPEMAKMLAIIEGLQKDLSELRTETAAQKAKREAEEARVESERKALAVLNSVTADFDAVKESVPKLAAQPDATAKIWEVINAYHQTWGHKKNFKFPTVAYVAKQLEAELQAESGAAAQAPTPEPKSEQPPEEAKRPNRRRLAASEIKDNELSLNPEIRRKQMARLVARVT